MKNKPIYFDYMATTPVDPSVAEKMYACLLMDGAFGNASANSHAYATSAGDLITTARQQIAELVCADAREIIFTSGATEANNLAILGAARFYKQCDDRRHVITLQTEHQSVLQACQQLEREGFRVTYLKPQPNGLLDLDVLEHVLSDDTLLVSIMHANNEIGVLQDIQSIGSLLKNKGIIFHVDAAQSAGKVSIDLSTLPVGLMSFSAHKLYGPKGVGALYVRRQPRVRLHPLLHGGGQEHQLRSGTLPTHQIVGMGAAFALAEKNIHEDNTRIKQLRDQLWAGICNLPGMTLNGDFTQRLPGNLNFSVAGVEGESLLLALHHLAISNTSACETASIEPSHVLRAIGVPQALAHSSIRIAIGRYTTEHDVNVAINKIREGVIRLQGLIS